MGMLTSQPSCLSHCRGVVADGRSLSLAHRFSFVFSSPFVFHLGQRQRIRITPTDSLCNRPTKTEQFLVCFQLIFLIHISSSTIEIECATSKCNDSFDRGALLYCVVCLCVYVCVCKCKTIFF